jgi:SAM-dependent methyltransferase
MVEAVSESWRPRLFSRNEHPAIANSGRSPKILRRSGRIGVARSALSASGTPRYCARRRLRCPTLPIARQPRRDLPGIDTDEAKEHFGYEMPNTTYFSGDVWPVAAASANVVLCTETLEHVLETRRFLAEAARCLAHGGTLLLTVPFAARWHFIPYDYWRFTLSSLDYLLTAAGFHGVRVYARGNACTVACYKLMTLLLLILMPQTESTLSRLLLRLAGVIFIPLFVLLGVVANLSLRGRGGDDCLGYTVLAIRSDQNNDSLNRFPSHDGQIAGGQ